MRVEVVAVANGRGDLLRAMIESVQANVRPLGGLSIFDDSGDPDFSYWLRSVYPDARIDAHRHLGHGPAIARAWSGAASLGADWVLWMEEDMLLQGPLDLQDVASVIVEANLVQMVLRRNAHFPAEIEAGPTQIDRFDPSLLHDRETRGLPWLEHRLFYSLNPHLVSTRFLARNRWPAVPNSEHHFSRRLFRDPKRRVGLWGSRDAPPLVLHAGLERTGTGY